MLSPWLMIDLLDSSQLRSCLTSPLRSKPVNNHVPKHSSAVPDIHAEWNHMGVLSTPASNQDV